MIRFDAVVSVVYVVVVIVAGTTFVVFVINVVLVSVVFIFITRTTSIINNRIFVCLELQATQFAKLLKRNSRLMLQLQSPTPITTRTTTTALIFLPLNCQRRLCCSISFLLCLVKQHYGSLLKALVCSVVCQFVFVCCSFLLLMLMLTSLLFVLFFLVRMIKTSANEKDGGFKKENKNNQKKNTRTNEVCSCLFLFVVRFSFSLPL